MCAHDLEGIVAKRLTDPYGPRVRWLKIKNPSYSQNEGRRELFDRSASAQPVIVRAIDPAKARKRTKTAPLESTPVVVTTRARRAVAWAAQPVPAPNADRKSAIVTARNPGKRYVDAPEVSEEEHRRVGDLADAMMAEFKRVIAEKIRS
jgi:hypothetical protein